jgi:two-component system chemotaxis response regulator CheY
MKILIAEDDYVSRKFLFEFLSKYGTCDITVDGMEALDAFLLALEDGKPYNLICLDIMMPKIDGFKALKAIRDIERQKGIDEGKKARIIITTALANTAEDFQASDTGSEAYVAKPIDTNKLLDTIKKFGLI